MEVISNNVANVNTPGFKGSRSEFSEVLSQMVRPGTRPGEGGASEPNQIGLGVRVSTNTNVMTQGSLLSTGRLGDAAIQGEGMFMVQQGDTTLYTRAGSFRFDADGNLCDPTGALVQGWMADKNGAISIGGAVTALKVDSNSTISAQSTQNITLGGRLPSDAAVGTVIQSQVTVYDSLGSTHQLEYAWTKTADNTWNQQLLDNGTALSTTGGTSSVTLQFDPTSGALLSPAAPNAISPASVTYNYTPAGGAATQAITVDFGAPGAGNPLTQFAGSATAGTTHADGSVAGSLRALAIADSGDIIATFSNGEIRTVGRIAVATFQNPGGLERVGDSHWRSGPASGTATPTFPGQRGAGTLAPGALEGSNVDLAQEFTNLIIAQRGFQANSRVVSTSDEMLQELIQIKR